MRCECLIAFACILLSLVLVIIIINQHHVMIETKEKNKKLSTVLDMVNSAYKDEDLFVVKLENLVKKGKTVADSLNAEVATGDPEQQQKKKEEEVNACQAEKEKKRQEMEDAEKELSKTKEKLKVESDAWDVDKNTLKAKLTGYSELCKYLKKNTIKLKICDSQKPNDTKDPHHQ